MKEADELIALLEEGQKAVAMLAPSFPIVYQYPNIIGKLKRLGFPYVVEVAAGAIKTNEALIKALKENPKARFITSPCASFTRMVKTKYPQMEKYLAKKVDSPMVATAKIVSEKWPGYRSVFIGPCNVKKLESSENYPELKILVLTYREMEDVFKHFAIGDDPGDANAAFDLTGKETRLYPISGGLAQSSGVRAMLSEDQIRVVSGWKNCEEALKDFEVNTNVKLLDILFCDGGCINGPGIFGELSLSDRRQKIVDYWNKDLQDINS